MTQTIMKNIGFKKTVPKKLKHFSIDCKKTILNSSDNLPLISSKNKHNNNNNNSILLVKNNMKEKMEKNSKLLKNYNYMALEIAKPKNILKNSRNNIMKNKTIFQDTSSIKNKSLFKIKSNITINGKSKFIKKSKVLLYLFNNNKAEEATEDNNIDNI